jgi:hypothetical protein
MELLPGEQKQAQNVERLYTEKVSMGILLNIPLGDGRLGGGYLGLRGTRRQGSGEDYITRNLMTCTHHQILFG